MSFEEIKQEGEATLNQNQAHESVENKIHDDDEKFTNQINGVMVTDEEYKNYIEQGKDAQ